MLKSFSQRIEVRLSLYVVVYIFFAPLLLFRGNREKYYSEKKEKFPATPMYVTIAYVTSI